MQVASDHREKMNPDYDFGSEKESGGDLYERLKVMEVERRDLALKMEEFKIAENSDEEEEEGEEEEEEEEEFSFAFSGGDEAEAIAAEEAFSNGQIKVVFPLFDQSLLLSGDGDGESDYLHQNLPMRPPVRRVFVETKEERGGAPPPESSEIAGPYCEWSSRKAVEASPESCKKSNSTGFSKIWRLKEITCRSNSDGRDAFVFLNGSHAPPPPAPAPAPAPAKAVEKKEAAMKKIVKKGKKAAAASPHEVYLRSKAKEEERRRSYLPYRPELMGFFTNINGGGLSRNVHPY